MRVEDQGEMSMGGGCRWGDCCWTDLATAAFGFGLRLGLGLVAAELTWRPRRAAWRLDTWRWHFIEPGGTHTMLARRKSRARLERGSEQRGGEEGRRGEERRGGCGEEVHTVDMGAHGGGAHGTNVEVHTQ